VPTPRSKPISIPSRGPRARRGFALLITLTLLSFLVLLLVGLATYTRVETAIAGNMQRQTQARENALLALNVAVAQLQKHAGPDQRATATAEKVPGADPIKARYTGVWSTDLSSATDARAPLAWLVSGAETGAVEDVTAALPVAQRVNLVSTGTATGTSSAVAAPLQAIRAPSVPGQPANASTIIGRYAWWVGDQGVKAPVAVADTSAGIDYAPFDSSELRSRIRQQLPFGASAADAGGATIFEPQDTNNASLVANGKIGSTTQLAFLRSPANSTVGLATLRQNFHAWSPNNFAVLANTRLGGLREDLSLLPGRLGTAFAAWANYPAYMEKLVADPPPAPDGEGQTVTPAVTAPSISPAYGSDPLRRRYVMTQVADPIPGGAHQVGPVLTYFLLTFNVRTEPTPGGSRSLGIKPLEVRARWMVSLWNPFTSALVPEDLRIEVQGLPTRVEVVNENATRPGTVAQFSLHEPRVFGSSLRINLPWNSTDVPSSAPSEDRQSWLPGRVYTWRSVEDISKGNTPPSGGYASAFYSRTLSLGGDGVVRPRSETVDGDDDCHLEVSGSSQLRVRLFVVRPSGDLMIAQFQSPQFVDGFTTATQPINGNDYQFSYVFRLAESIDTPASPGTWLTAPQRDFRRTILSEDFFVVGENGNDPAQYGGSYSKIGSPDRLLDRAENGRSYNEDVPVFELPRAPLLSLGSLQHFRIRVQRPFSIGNPWGMDDSLNGIRTGELFDRFFFSGLADGVTPATTATGDLILPNPLLRPLRKSNGTKPAFDDIRQLANPPLVTTTDPDGNVVTTPSAPPSAFSSKFLLQGGAFNLNSTNPAAWRAVLRGVRFPAPNAFTYLNASESTGTAGDGAKASDASSSDARFFRFSQSAQETFKAEAGVADTSGTSAANTHLFRRGMRTLTGDQVAALATRIAELVGVKHAAADLAGGPFRSLEEFLTPSTLFAGLDAEGNAGSARSLLEAAIADAGINADIAEFSSQWLTQADVMTALAPILFPRSDTFLVRAYGEAVNPATAAVEGRAWCEALVQRLPEYFDPSDAPETPVAAFDVPQDPNDVTSVPTTAHQFNKLYGRRFKVVSFRWLTRSDL
jgi:Tfp pilus assembly protein PilX